MKKLLFIAPLLFLAPLLSVAQQTEKVDLSTIHRIKEEALGRNSKVMDHVFYLTDVNGPRLNNSKGYRAAGDWAVKRLKEYGLANVHLEKWGPFGKGWNLEHYSGHMLEPQYQPIIAMPVAWTAGTDGVVSGNPVLVTPQTQAELDAFKGKLAGKIVLISPKRDLAMSTTPLGGDGIGLLDKRNQVIEEVLGKGIVVGTNGHQRHHAAAGSWNMAVGHDDDHVLQFALGIEVVEDQVDLAGAGPGNVVIAATVQQVENRQLALDIFKIGRQIDMHPAFGVERGGVVDYL